MKKFVLFGLCLLISLAAFTVWQYIRFNDGKLHVIFCDIGQGDAVVIKTPNNKYILYDGGPDRLVLQCLADAMPFWHRKVDMVILSHPHADHFFGMFYVLERYDVGLFATEDLVNETKAYQELIRQIDKKKIRKTFVSAGDAWEVGGVRVDVVGPSEVYLQKTSPGGKIGESKEFASLVLQLQYDSFSTLLTGDSQVQGLEDAADQVQGEIDVFHVPHHGSKSGLDEKMLFTLKPSLAVVSVGAENRYNHPHPQIMELLQSQQIKTLRTDQMGDIEIVSNGHTWEVRP